MARLACPHCGGPVAANPIGRWFQRFQCPHCRKSLQFDGVTNNLGMASWFCFATMMLAIVLGRADWTPWLAAACGALWIVLALASYQLRKVVKA